MDLRLTMFCLMSTVLPLACLAQSVPAYELECRNWVDVPIPEQDIGTAPLACSAVDLYYGKDGLGEERDYAAARQCAYQEHKNGRDPNPGSVFEGSSILMMLYANGQGVPRNIQLAKRFVCETGGAPAEIMGRFEHLDAIAQGKDIDPMDFCDDVTSGMMGGMCAFLHSHYEQYRRDKQWTVLQTSWTEAQRAALEQLRMVANDYFELSASEEHDMSGSARIAIATEISETSNIVLLDDILRLEDGWRPPPNTLAFAETDSAMNDVYREVVARVEAELPEGGGPGDYGTVYPEGIRQTQNRWLDYREAWVNFAASHYPEISADTWRAWLTERRSQALKEIIGMDRE
jgi:uncharacterized protein YecT (DUF1311 family)